MKYRKFNNKKSTPGHRTQTILLKNGSTRKIVHYPNNASSKGLDKIITLIKLSNKNLTDRQHKKLKRKVFAV